MTTYKNHPCPQADLWILAGQSNMEGIADFAEKFPEHPRLWSFGMDLQWAPAVPPLHHLFCSSFPIHRRRVESAEVSSEVLDKIAARGRAGTLPICGCGYFFCQYLLKKLPAERQIALLPTAHGGTNLDEWMPKPGAEPGTTLYSAMMEQARLSGLRPTGMLWYQGESDCRPEFASTYLERFTEFVAALRRDLNDLDFAVFTVQLARMLDWPFEKEIDIVRNAQAEAAERIPHVYCTSALDGELRDQIHIGLEAQKTLGERLARLVLTEHYGVAGEGRSPRLARVRVERVQRPPVRPWYDPPLFYKAVLEYENVGGGWSSAGRPTGFSLEIDSPLEAPPQIFLTELNKPAPGNITLWLPFLLQPDMNIRLAYGQGRNPYCNITDANNLPPLAFTDLKITLADQMVEIDMGNHAT